MKPKYKNPVVQEMFEKALQIEYPHTGGSEAYNFNLGYEGIAKKPPRASRFGSGWIMFYAGREKRKIDKIKDR